MKLPAENFPSGDICTERASSTLLPKYLKFCSRFHNLDDTV